MNKIEIVHFCETRVIDLVEMGTWRLPDLD
jgi:hypothetical protein